MYRHAFYDAETVNRDIYMADNIILFINGHWAY